MLPSDLAHKHIIDQSLADEISRLGQLRNRIVHGDDASLNDLSESDIDSVKQANKKLTSTLANLQD